MAGYPISERFWAASSAAAATERRRDRKRVFTTGTFRRKEELWSQKADYYLRGYKGLSGRFQMVRVDPALQRIVLDLMGQVAPALQAAFDDHLGRLAFSAWGKWPFYTGLSQSLLSLEYSVEGDGSTFRGSIYSRAPYTVFIKGQPHRALIDQPSAAVAERIAADGLAAIGRP